MPAMTPPLSGTVPCSSIAICQWPLAWLTTNGLDVNEASSTPPPALQLPAEAHDTDATPASTTLPRPRTLLALPQVPFRSLTTNACAPPATSRKAPPAVQSPSEGHEIDSTAWIAWDWTLGRDKPAGLGTAACAPALASAMVMANELSAVMTSALAARLRSLSMSTSGIVVPPRRVRLMPLGTILAPLEVSALAGVAPLPRDRGFPKP